MKKKISVIGGAGFIGTNLCDLLNEKKIPFEIIDLKLSKSHKTFSKLGDVRNLDSMRKTITGDIVINLAAIHRDDVKNKSEYNETNVLGAQIISKVCMEKKIKKIIFTSSVAVYDTSYNNITESGLINPSNHYGKSKQLAEKEYEKWQLRTNDSLIIIRPTAVFGEGNRGNIYNLFSQISSNRFLMVGSGKNIKSIAYVKNLACFILKCITFQTNYIVFNYADCPNLKIIEIVKIIRKIIKGKDNIGLKIPYWLGLLIGYVFDISKVFTGNNYKISAIRIKKFCSYSSFSSENMKKIDFYPPFSIIDGLEKTLTKEFLSKNPVKNIFHTE